MKNEKDSLGGRMKFYEKLNDKEFLPYLPIMCRLDGKAFHTFTRGLKRPYDVRLSTLMIDTAKYLLEATNAVTAYTQFDEITLAWLPSELDKLIFCANTNKLISLTASTATAYFNKNLPKAIPEKADRVALFDARVWQMPSSEEAANNFIWREQDAVRNSVQMAAQSVYSHNECFKKNNSELQEMLHEKGINWNDYPTFFKRGSYIRRRITNRKLTEEELLSLPPKHNAHLNPDLIIERSVIMVEDFDIMTRYSNRAQMLLHGADPILATEICEGER